MTPLHGPGLARPLDFPCSASHPFSADFEPALRRELEALCGESDPELRDEALFGLGGRLEAAGRPQDALEVYAGVETEAWRTRAATRREALLGRGPIGPRAERLLRHFAREAADPAALAAMTLGATVFRLTRLSVLARLSASPTANFFTRGLGVRTVASLAGWSLEAPAFALTARSLRRLSGRANDEIPLSTELASSWIMLGALKLSGSLGSAVSRRLGSEGSLAAAGFRQSSLLGGLILARRVEAGLYLRPAEDGTGTVLDSLATLLQFHVAGRLGHSLGGSRWAAWNQALERQAEGFVSQPLHLRVRALRPAAVGFDPRLPGSNILMMSSDKSDPPSSGSLPTRRISSHPSTLLRVTDLYMIVITLPRALRMAEPSITYEGDAWVESRDAAAIAGRLREVYRMPREQHLELHLARQNQRLVFFWEGDNVRYRIVVSGSGPTAAPRSTAAATTAATLPEMGAVSEPSAARAGEYRLHSISEEAPHARPKRGRTPPAAFAGWQAFESGLDRQIEALFRQILAESPPGTQREESGALRGRHLARIANHAFKAETEEDTLRSIQPVDVAVKIQSLLDQAYRHFDFGTVQSFRERLSLRGTDAFAEALELYNMRLRHAGSPPLLTLDEMRTELPGAYLLPRSQALRDAFLERWVLEVPVEAGSRRVPELLENPRRIARLSAPVLGRRLETFARQVQTLRQGLPRESLEDLLHPDRGYASEAGPKLRDELHRFLVELPELSRLLAEGRGPFHREYLRELFFSGSEPLQRPYAEFLRWLPLLPVEYREANGSRIFFPTPNQVRDFARGSARPLPR